MARQPTLFDVEPKEVSLFDSLMEELHELNRDAEKQNKRLEKMILALNPDCKTYEEVHAKLNPPKDKKPIFETEIILSMEAIEVLKQCTVQGHVVKLPANQLDRKDYEAVKKKLELIGGKWKGGKVQGFEFKEDPTSLLEEISSGGDRNIKKEFQFFATPDSLAFKMATMAEIEPEHEILEPSAGQGALIKAVNALLPNSFIDCFELMPLNKQFLGKIPTANIIGEDFLLSDVKQYDRIIANPPFTKNQDIDHIKKMFNCLKNGGRLVTVASPSWTQGNQKKQVEFREWLEEINAHIEEIPAGTFKESGTSIKAILIVIDKAA